MLRVNRMASEERIPSPDLISYVTRPETVQSTFFGKAGNQEGCMGLATV